MLGVNEYFFLHEALQVFLNMRIQNSYLHTTFKTRLAAQTVKSRMRNLLNSHIKNYMQNFIGGKITHQPQAYIRASVTATAPSAPSVV